MAIFDFHYGNESEQYAFYRVPKVLIKNKFFKNVSAEAKLLYGLMLDRLSLSLKNGWCDEENRIFIFYTLEDIQEDLDCSHGKAVKLLSELDIIGLISRTRQGLGKPSKVYVRKFIDMNVNCVKETETTEVQNSEIKTSENETSGSTKIKLPEVQKSEVLKYKNRTSGSTKIGSQEVQNLDGNYNNISNTEYSDTEISQSCQSSPLLPERQEHKTDRQDEDKTDNIEQKITTYGKLIKDNICYESLALSRKFDTPLINDFIDIMIDTILTPNEYVRINGEDKPRELVKNSFLKIGCEEMEHAIDQFKGVTETIRNKKRYIVSLLYNCRMEMNLHYTNLVKHDMYG